MAIRRHETEGTRRTRRRFEVEAATATGEREEKPEVRVEQPIEVNRESVEASDNTFSVTGESQLFSGARKRKYLFIANVGGNNMRVSFGKPATNESGVPLAPNGFYEPLVPLGGSINIIAAGGTTALIIEG